MTTAAESKKAELAAKIIFLEEDASYVANTKKAVLDEMEQNSAHDRDHLIESFMKTKESLNAGEKKKIEEAEEMSTDMQTHRNHILGDIQDVWHHVWNELNEQMRGATVNQQKELDERMNTIEGYERERNRLNDDIIHLADDAKFI